MNQQTNFWTDAGIGILVLRITLGINLSLNGQGQSAKL